MRRPADRLGWRTRTSGTKRRPLTRSDAVSGEARRLVTAGCTDAAVELLADYAGEAHAFDAACAAYLDLLLGLGRRADADAAFDQALKAFGSTPDAFDALAFYARRLDRHELARALYRKVTSQAPADGQAWYNLASAERTLGRLSEAAEACSRALEADPSHAPAVLLRSELRPATNAHNHVVDLRTRLTADLGDRTQMFTAFALGKELHDLARYDEAFDAFAQGARVRRRNLAYDVAQDERKLARIEEVYDRPVRQRAPLTGRHIFIIGLPRSGTTLTERILGGLPGVRSNGETDNFSTALLQCAPSGPGDVFERCGRAESARVAERYDALASCGGTAERVIEKLPLNYLYVGAIAAALPQSPIVWVRRNPVDSCFAMFRTLFGEGYPFSYDFDDLARYYAAYDRLRRHWQAIAPNQLIAVDYEELVVSPDHVGARVAERCALTWNDRALNLSRNRAPSTTASASQVRGAIYATSAGVSRRYGQNLAPLAAALRRNGVLVPNEDADDELRK